MPERRHGLCVLILRHLSLGHRCLIASRVSIHLRLHLRILALIEVDVDIRLVVHLDLRLVINLLTSHLIWHAVLRVRLLHVLGILPR